MTLDEATPAQKAAILSNDPDILCVAGPGAGKTATLIARIERQLASGVKPSEIVCLTFTNTGAGEIARRLPFGPIKEKDGDQEPVRLGFCGTLHSFALKVLKEHGAPFGYGDGVSIISPDSAQDLIESKMRTLNCKASLKDVMALKRNGRPQRGKRLDSAELVLTAYFDELAESKVVDYDLLLTELLRILMAGGETQAALALKFLHLYVDEVQDSAPIDWQIYRALPIANKFFVGDPDQAIFGFRGGRVQEMIAYSTEPGTRLIVLERNFRSSAEVCSAANHLIEHNVGRVKKLTISNRGTGGGVYFAPLLANEGDEIGNVCRSIKDVLKLFSGTTAPTIAVLTRTNHVATAFAKTLAACGIPVVERKVEELPGDWVLARSYVELLVHPDNDSLAFFHLIALNEKAGMDPGGAREVAHEERRAAAAQGVSLNRRCLGINRVSEPRIAVQALAQQPISLESRRLALERYHELPAGATMLDFALSLGEVRERVSEDGNEGVRVMTIHGSKGREFSIVYLVGFEDESIPGSRAVKAGPEAVEEERRLAYVAITRAKNKVFITGAESRLTKWGAVVKRTPSRFIKEMLPI